MPHFYREVFSAIALLLTFAAFAPYVYAIHRQANRPHLFSWVIWGITTTIVFIAQLQDNAGLGAWPIGLGAAISFYIALAAYCKRADTDITRLDWIFFGLALLSLPLWYMTSDPVWAVILLTLIDILGFGPTIRKIYAFPYSESLSLYLIYVARNLLVILALENYSVTTLFFPLAIGIVCILVVFIALYQRRVSV